MPIVNIQISDVKQKQNNITFVATTNDKVIVRTLNKTDIDNWNDFAEWLINQEHDFELLPDKEKSLTITFHLETIIDAETGLEITTKIVDDVIIS